MNFFKKLFTKEKKETLDSGLKKSKDSFFNKISKVIVGKSKVDDEVLDNLEEVLISSDVGVKTTLKIIDHIDFLSIGDNKPHVILVVGVNGVGKTTSIGKMANHYKSLGLKVMIGAADTFRAAAIDQLEVWKTNLMNELGKIKRVLQKKNVNAPHEVLLVIDGSTGQNAFEQAKQFTSVTEITSLAVTKLDGTAKGGVVLGISDQFNIPIKFIGVGEGIEDLQVFNKIEFVDSFFKKS